MGGRNAAGPLGPGEDNRKSNARKSIVGQRDFKRPDAKMILLWRDTSGKNTLSQSVHERGPSLNELVQFANLALDRVEPSLPPATSNGDQRVVTILRGTQRGNLAVG